MTGTDGITVARNGDRIGGKFVSAKQAAAAKALAAKEGSLTFPAATLDSVEAPAVAHHTGSLLTCRC